MVTFRIYGPKYPPFDPLPFSDDEEEEDVLPELPDLTVLAPDAGKIRFAEDLIEDVRGGRRDRRGRRGGGARGAARGGGR